MIHLAMGKALTRMLLGLGARGRPYRYWRGHTWGPLATIVYWGLSDSKYAASALVTTARAALARQMREVMGAVWRAEHHVCENYSPYRQPGEAKCTGDPFYTWGGLTGFLSFLELAHGQESR